MIYQAKHYKNRNELDIATRNRTPEENDLITGTKEELSDLSLSESCNVYGVKVKIE